MSPSARGSGQVRKAPGHVPSQLIRSTFVELLKPVFRGDIVLPGDPDYETAVHRWSVTAVRTAGIVAYPKIPEDVSHVIKFATEQPAAVRPSGTSSSDGGAVIDLSRYVADSEVAEWGTRRMHLKKG